MPGKPLIYQDDTIVASPAAAAETVVCRLRGVASRYGNAVKLSGWVNVTPDTDATAIVLRVRRGTTTGGTLVTPAETVGFGASAGGGAVVGTLSGVVSADAPTAVPADGALHAVLCAIAVPPTWMDNASQITAEGIYEIVSNVSEVGVIATPGQFVGIRLPVSITEGYGVEALAAKGPLSGSEIVAVDTGDLPFLVSVVIDSPTDATASFSVINSVAQLASVVGAGGGGVTPGDAVLDVIDLPGQIAQASYVLTAQMTGANSPSTINGVKLTARVD